MCVLAVERDCLQIWAEECWSFDGLDIVLQQNALQLARNSIPKAQFYPQFRCSTGSFKSVIIRESLQNNSIFFIPHRKN